MTKISIICAWLNDPDKNNHRYHYYCCEHSALIPTKKFLLNKGYRRVRTVMTIEKDQLGELKQALDHPVEVCDTVCEIVKEKLILQCGGSNEVKK